VQIEGTANDVSGKCPNLTFSVSGRRVETNGETDFDNKSCKDLEKRERKVRVTGFERPDGVVTATRVEDLGKGEDDDEDDDDDDDDDD
jgi:hypothetical protein